MSVITLYFLLIVDFLVMMGLFLYAVKRYKKSKELAPYIVEIDWLKKDINNKEIERDELIENNETLRHDKDVALDTIQRANELKQELKDNERKLKDLTIKVNIADNSLQTLNHEIEQKAKELEASTKRFENSEQVTNQVRREAASARLERDDLKKQSDDLRIRVETLNSDIIEKEDLIRQKKDEERRISNHVAELISQEKEVNVRMEELTNQVKELKNQLKGLEELGAQKTELINEIANKQDYVQSLEKSMAEYRTLEDRARVAYEKMQDTQKTLEKELQSLEEQKFADNRELKTLEENLVALRDRKEKEELRIEEWKQKAQVDLEEFITKKEQEKRKYEVQQQTALAEKNKIYAGQQAALTAHLEALAEERKRKDAEAEKAIAEIQKRIDDKRGELNAVTKKQEDTAHQLTQLKAEIGEIDEKQVQEKQQKRWADLIIPVFHDTTDSAENMMEESEWLTEFKNNLKTCGVKFDDRIINAFHTSLKVADASPMVVLAGISGTGKSLLPQLYAQAMGMNFLTVAVQPRWDSPQDMFGFFNYMEGRYKATELSRLLWQYDLFNNPEGTRQYQNHLPMNLVLLDEMNLAKVEYYFSDMLSKLEVRRTVNPKNEKERHQAEIELDGGAMAEKDQPRRLYVARNTLFVGTMNEDESTQALSDKVMDRANVMRFGYPQVLETKPNLEKFRDCYGEYHMTWERWSKNWLYQKASANSQKLQKIMLDVNKSLAEIGRPFAHRVWQSMVAYVDNYPLVEDSFKHAVADQFEMKILPKLNGVDKEDPAVKKVLGEIAGILQDNLKGEQIIDDFDKAKDNPSDAFFQWRGITR